MSNTVQPRWAGQLEQKGERYSFENTGSSERGERFARSERSGEPRRSRGPQREGRGQGFGFGGQKQGFGRGPSRGAGGAQGERGRGRQATPERTWPKPWRWWRSGRAWQRPSGYTRAQS